MVKYQRVFSFPRGKTAISWGEEARVVCQAVACVIRALHGGLTVMGAENGTASGSRAGTIGIDRCDRRLRGRPGASQMIWSVSFLAKKTCGLSGRPAMHNELGCYNYRLGEKREGRPPGTYTNLHRGHPLRRLPRPPVTHPGRHLSQHGSRSAAQGAKRRRAIGRRDPPRERKLHCISVFTSLN